MLRCRHKQSNYWGKKEAVTMARKIARSEIQHMLSGKWVCTKATEGTPEICSGKHLYFRGLGGCQVAVAVRSLADAPKGSGCWNVLPNRL